MFQYRVLDAENSHVYRLCEERIVLFRSDKPTNALRDAKKYCKKSEFRFKNDSGRVVCFELVGIMDLIDLDLACEENEVWFEIKKRKLPKETVAVPLDDQLNAIAFEKKYSRSLRSGEC